MNQEKTVVIFFLLLVACLIENRFHVFGSECGNHTKGTVFEAFRYFPGI